MDVTEKTLEIMDEQSTNREDNQLIEKLASVFRERFPHAKNIHIAGILSYTADNNREQFLKMDFDVIKKFPKLCEGESATDSEDSLRHTYFETSLDSPLHSDVKDVDSVSSNKCPPMPDSANVYPTDRDAASASDDSVHSNRRDRRKCKNPKRQPSCFDLSQQSDESSSSKVRRLCTITQNINVERPTDRHSPQKTSRDSLGRLLLGSQNNESLINPNYEDSSDHCALPKVDDSTVDLKVSCKTPNPDGCIIKQSEIESCLSVSNASSFSLPSLERVLLANNSVNLPVSQQSVISIGQLERIRNCLSDGSLQNNGPSTLAVICPDDIMSRMPMVSSSAITNSSVSVNSFVPPEQLNVTCPSASSTSLVNSIGCLDSEKLLDTLNLLRYVSSQNNVNQVLANNQNRHLVGTMSSIPNITSQAQVLSNNTEGQSNTVCSTSKQHGITSISVCPTLAVIGTIEPCLSSINNGYITTTTCSTVLGPTTAMTAPQLASTLRQNQCITLSTTDVYNTAAVATALLRNLAASKQSQVSAECGGDSQSCNPLKFNTSDLAMATKQEKCNTDEYQPDIGSQGLTSVADTNGFTVETSGDSANAIMTTVLNRCMNTSAARRPLLMSYSRGKGLNVMISPHVTKTVPVSTANSPSILSSENALQNIAKSVLPVTEPPQSFTSLNERLSKRKANKSSGKSSSDEVALNAGETASAIDRILQTIKVCMNKPETVINTKSVKSGEVDTPSDKRANSVIDSIRVCQLNEKNVYIPVKMTAVSVSPPKSTSQPSGEDRQSLASKEHSSPIGSVKDRKEDEGQTGFRRTYRCHYCGKLFNRKFCRERHERLHTGIKPYTCEICNEKFIRLEDKKRHVRSLQHYTTERILYKKVDTVVASNHPTENVDQSEVLSVIPGSFEAALRKDRTEVNSPVADMAFQDSAVHPQEKDDELLLDDGQENMECDLNNAEPFPEKRTKATIVEHLPSSIYLRSNDTVVNENFDCSAESHIWPVSNAFKDKQCAVLNFKERTLLKASQSVSHEDAVLS